MEIESMFSVLKVYISSAKEGKGPVNYLLRETVFVQHLDNTIINIEQGSEWLNKNMEAMKSNFLFSAYYKQQEKEEKKTAKREWLY